MISPSEFRDAISLLEEATSTAKSSIALEYQQLYAQDANLAVAVLSGLGSKYLAIGAPATCGIVGGRRAASAIADCHTHLFGPMEFRVVSETESGLSLEEAFGCDIVCVPGQTKFSLDWIAEATHLNFYGPNPVSPDALTLCEFSTATTLEELQNPTLRSLAAVIRGQVSGRMGEEITMLLELL